MDKLAQGYDKLSKKQLKKHLLRQINDNIFMNAENYSLNKLLSSKETHLRSVESALEYKEVVIDKYKKLLETSVEHL
jgi:regulator of replication initiation timing